jgi:predicted RNA-binding Zn ribbon-like protein
MRLMADVRPAPLALVVDMVNGWSGHVRRESGQERDPYPDQIAMCRVHGWEGPTTAHDQMVAVTDRIHGVFSGATADERRTALNQAVAALAPTPQVTTDGEVWGGVDAQHPLEAALLFALVEHARTDPDLVRLGVCAADHCVDAYVDTSRATTRRFCSLTCQNRARVAAFRRRTRDPAART